MKPFAYSLAMPRSRAPARRLHAMRFAQTAESARPKGDQHREYVFAPTGQQMPYRIYVPTRWDGKARCRSSLLLHGAGANESTYLDIAGGLLEKLAEQHGYIVVSPLGFTPLGAYGNPLRLPAVFGESKTAAAQRAARHARAPARARLERARGRHRARDRHRGIRRGSIADVPRRTFDGQRRRMASRGTLSRALARGRADVGAVHR